MDIFKLRAKLQLLNRILTILLHLCCSSAPTRLADASTFKHSVLSWNFHAENWCCSCKLLYKMKLFRTCHLFLSFCRKRIRPFKSASASGKKRKVPLSTFGESTFRSNAGNSIGVHEGHSNTTKTERENQYPVRSRKLCTLLLRDARCTWCMVSASVCCPHQ